jgi:hypothetical protein
MKERVPPRHMGSMAISKGPYLEPISVIREKKKSWHQDHKKAIRIEKDWDETFEDGTWSTCRHVTRIAVIEV